MSSPVPISIRFAGSTFEFAAAKPVTFGRGTEPVDIPIDESNAFLHRTAGLIDPTENGWVLHNVGGTTRLALSTDLGAAFDLAPGTSVPLPGPGGTIRFTAGRCRYELVYATERGTELERSEPEGAETTDARELFTPMQRAYLACYARIMIHEGRVPQREEVGELMGGKSIKTVDAHVREAKDRAFKAGLAPPPRRVPVEELVGRLRSHNVFSPDELLPNRSTRQPT